jgi:hypothetical protein
VPTDDRILVGVGLFSDTIIQDYHPVFVLDLAHIGLDNYPQVSRTQRVFSQQPLDLIMTDAASQQSSQSRSGRLSKGTDTDSA